jgi:hypothetical protein
MPECPVCRREFDARFEVFAGPSGQSYDTVECARRAASSAGDQEIFPPALLPTIELLPLARPTAAAPLVTSRRRLAAAFAIPFVASPAAVAAGLSLVAVGTATSLALWFPSLDGNGKPVITAAAAAPTAPPSLAVAPPAHSSKPGDAGAGKQPSESSARAVDQGASESDGLISFAESDAPEHPQIGGDSDLGNEEPSLEVPSPAPPSHTPPPPKKAPPPPPVPVSEGEPVTPAGPKPPAGPKSPAGLLPPSLPGTPPSSPESEAPPPPPPDDPSPRRPPTEPPPAPLWSTPSAPPTEPPPAPPTAAPPTAAPLP